MGLAGMFVGKTLYYKSTRDQHESNTFVLEGITQNLRQFICYNGSYFMFDTP